MDFGEYLKSVESAELSDTFFDVALVQNLDTSVSTSPYFNVYLAAQVKLNDKGFLSKDITVKDLISHKGDIHHIFPRDYLKRYGLTKGQYNQVADYAYTQSEINIKVGNKAPEVYLNELREQCNNGKLKYGGINDFGMLTDNFKQNCILESVFSMNIENYDDFLEQRRMLMARKIKQYYLSL